MNYILEGNVNFNDKLLKALCDPPNPNKDVNKACLISNCPLDVHAITLQCGHHFNYKPLFKEIVKQKTFNRLETQKLKKFQIKCPYCRTIHNHILPYYAIDTTITRIWGVNWPSKYALRPHRCKALLKSGKRKGDVCNAPSFEKFCNKHKTKLTDPITRCCAILKSGKNAGKQCHYKMKKGGRCGLHQL